MRAVARPVPRTPTLLNQANGVAVSSDNNRVAGHNDVSRVLHKNVRTPQPDVLVPAVQAADVVDDVRVVRDLVLDPVSRIVVDQVAAVGRVEVVDVGPDARSQVVVNDVVLHHQASRTRHLAATRLPPCRKSSPVVLRDDVVRDVASYSSARDALLPIARQVASKCGAAVQTHTGTMIESRRNVLHLPADTHVLVTDGTHLSRDGVLGDGELRNGDVGHRVRSGKGDSGDAGLDGVVRWVVETQNALPVVVEKPSAVTDVGSGVDMEQRHVVKVQVFWAIAARVARGTDAVNLASLRLVPCDEQAGARVAFEVVQNACSSQRRVIGGGANKHVVRLWDDCGLPVQTRDKLVRRAGRVGVHDRLQVVRGTQHDSGDADCGNKHYFDISAEGDFSVFLPVCWSFLSRQRFFRKHDR